MWNTHCVMCSFCQILANVTVMLNNNEFITNKLVVKINSKNFYINKKGGLDVFFMCKSLKNKKAWTDLQFSSNFSCVSSECNAFDYCKYCI